MEEGSPVSQMQKIALQRVNNDGTRHYLSAAGPLPGGGGGPPGNSSPSGTHPLLFQAPREREEVRDGMHIVSDEVDDYLCWTIVGICGPPLTPTLADADLIHSQIPIHLFRRFQPE